MKEAADCDLSLAATSLQCSFTEAAVGGQCSAMVQANDRVEDEDETALAVGVLAAGDAR